jgi:hypothetical protein
LLLQLNTDGSARVETVSDELHAVMRCSVGGTDRSELYAIFASFDADREEADEVLAELVDSGVLIHS